MSFVWDDAATLVRLLALPDGERLHDRLSGLPVLNDTRPDSVLTVVVSPLNNTNTVFTLPP